MPSVLLPAPLYSQSRDGFCLPACARMILAYWGDSRPEDEVAALLGTRPYGTPITKVARLITWGYDVAVVNLSPPALMALLNDGVPAIVRVWTPMLGYWAVDAPHVVVAVGYDEQSVWLNDPAFAEAVHAVNWDAFLTAWAEFDELAVIIQPARS